MLNVEQIGCGSKQQFTTHNRAVHAAKTIGRITGRAWDAYNCEWCHFYHIGNRRGYGKDSHKNKQVRMTRQRLKETWWKEEHEADGS